jgi:urease accessory protein
VLAQRLASGAFHLSKPYWDGHALMVQWINPTAGVFAGDVLESTVNVDPGAALVLTTPSATRIHKRMNCAHAAGQSRQGFHVAGGAWLEVQSEWLMPQADSAFVQRTDIHLDHEAGFFYTELLAPGRVAHGEALLFDELDLRMKVVIGGRLVLQERLHASKGKTWMLSRDDAPLFVATALVRLPGRESKALALLRSAADVVEDCELGATMIEGGLIVVRLSAPRGAPIRKAITWMRRTLATHSPELSADLRKL